MLRCMRFLPVVAAVFSVLASRVCVAQPEEGAGIVTMELLADRTAVADGEKVTLGVRFKIKPEWHIYWVNPGESGFETKVEWSGMGLDSGQSTIYPAPIKFVSPGPLTSYGYADEVLLMNEVAVKLPQPPPGEVRVSVKAKWLMCADRCIPGKGDAALTLPVGKSAPANAELFAKYRALLPQSVGGPDVKIGTTKKDKGFATEITVTPPDGMTIAAGDSAKARGAYFFPLKVGGVELGVPVIPPSDGKVMVDGVEIPVYTKPFTIVMTSEPFDNKNAAIPVIEGILVTQPLDRNGVVQKIGVKRVGSTTP
jgi:DsbC/DsbD-like thiol-disulfide interchange protein